MLTKRDLELKLSEYRARHTGKVPFGPVDDLERLHSSLSESEKLILDSLLQERSNDSFWKDFVALFREAHDTAPPE